MFYIDPERLGQFQIQFNFQTIFRDHVVAKGPECDVIMFHVLQLRDSQLL